MLGVLEVLEVLEVLVLEVLVLEVLVLKVLVLKVLEVLVLEVLVLGVLEVLAEAEVGGLARRSRERSERLAEAGAKRTPGGGGSEANAWRRRVLAGLRSERLAEAEVGGLARRSRSLPAVAAGAASVWRRRERSERLAEAGS